MEDHILEGILKYCNVMCSAPRVCLRWYRCFEKIHGSARVLSNSMLLSGVYGEVDCIRYLLPLVTDSENLYDAATCAAGNGRLEALTILCNRILEPGISKYNPFTSGIMTGGMADDGETRLVGLHTGTLGYVGCCAAATNHPECALYVYKLFPEPISKMVNAEFLKASIIGGCLDLTKYFLELVGFGRGWDVIRDVGYGNHGRNITQDFQDHQVECFKYLAQHYYLRGNLEKMLDTLDIVLGQATPKFRERCFNEIHSWF